MSKSKQYKIILESDGNETKYRDKDLDKAIMSIDIDWKRIRYKYLMKVEYDGKSMERMYNIGKLKRLFNNKIFRATEVKFIKLLLK